MSDRKIMPSGVAVRNLPIVSGLALRTYNGCVCNHAGDFSTTPAQLRARANEVFRWMAEGKLRMKWTMFPMDEASTAHELLQSRQTMGKLLLDCAQTAPGL